MWEVWFGIGPYQNQPVWGGIPTMEKEYGGWQKMYTNSEWRKFSCWKNSINLMQEVIVVHGGNTRMLHLKSLTLSSQQSARFFWCYKNKRKEGAPNWKANLKSRNRKHLNYFAQTKSLVWIWPAKLIFLWIAAIIGYSCLLAKILVYFAFYFVFLLILVETSEGGWKLLWEYQNQIFYVLQILM